MTTMREALQLDGAGMRFGPMVSISAEGRALLNTITDGVMRALEAKLRAQLAYLQIESHARDLHRIREARLRELDATLPRHFVLAPDSAFWQAVLYPGEVGYELAAEAPATAIMDQTPPPALAELFAEVDRLARSLALDDNGAIRRQ